ncbi:E3 ubiquitin-protein ligase cblA [Mycena sanguinolenta]|uniref:E3 ubiquitin-protein ligase cblA n=1 Tax=Mycena sanguinolenta TaxID=230812 RepID=A0A8H7D6K6_9AGAR|nr:E3 ubiquitin-protein ligase cblA [Mycena sanguinolenta]
MRAVAHTFDTDCSSNVELGTMDALARARLELGGLQLTSAHDHQYQAYPPHHPVRPRPRRPFFAVRGSPPPCIDHSRPRRANVSRTGGPQSPQLVHQSPELVRRRLELIGLDSPGHRHPGLPRPRPRPPRTNAQPNNDQDEIGRQPCSMSHRGLAPPRNNVPPTQGGAPLRSNLISSPPRTGPRPRIGPPPRTGPRPRTGPPPRPQASIPPDPDPIVVSGPDTLTFIPPRLHVGGPSPPSTSALEELERAGRRTPELERTGLCVICQDEEAIMVVVNCGHLAMCRECSDAVMSGSRSCPLCRTSIERLIRVFKT